MPPSKNISFDELAQYFHLPINQVAKELGVCATILKKTCRRNGIPRWPHRKIKSLENRISNLQVNLDKNPQDREEICKEIELLKAKKQEIMKHPDILVRNSHRNGDASKSKSRPKHKTERSKDSTEKDEDSSDDASPVNTTATITTTTNSTNAAPVIGVGQRYNMPSVPFYPPQPYLGMGTDMVNYAYMQNIHTRVLEERQTASMDQLMQANKVSTSGLSSSLYGIPPTPYMAPAMYSDPNYYPQSSAYRPDMTYQMPWGPTTSKNYPPFYPQHIGYSYPPTVDIPVKQQDNLQDGKSVVIGQVYRPVPPEYLDVPITHNSKSSDTDKSTDARTILGTSDRTETPSHQFTTSRLYNLSTSGV